MLLLIYASYDLTNMLKYRYVTLHANYNRKIVSWFEQTYPCLQKDLPQTKDLPPSILKRLAHHFAEKIDPRTGSSVSLQIRREIRDSLGGRLFNIVTGGGKIEKDTISFLDKTFFGKTSSGKSQSSRVVDSYGSTECPGISQNGIVNTASYEFKLVGEMSSSEDIEIGEIWVRPKFNFTIKREYLNSPEESKHVFLKSGWYVTGDMGQLKYNSKGEARLEILGRKKTHQEELYVNHASVWVDVKALESCFSEIPIVRNVFLVGDRNRSSLVAVVVLTNEHMDIEEDEIIHQFTRFAPNDAKSYEIPRAVVTVSSESWKCAVESGHSSKIQRLALKQHFADSIAESFARLEEEEGGQSDVKQKSIKRTSFGKEDLERVVKSLTTPWNLNRKEQPQLHVPKDFVDFRFRLENKNEEQALNRILCEAVVYVMKFRSSRDKWIDLMKAHHVHIKKRESEFQCKMKTMTNDIMSMIQTLIGKIIATTTSPHLNDSSSNNWFLTFKKICELIESRKLFALQHQVETNNFTNEERRKCENSLNLATSRLTRLARYFKTNVPWQISSGAWLMSSSDDSNSTPLLEQSMGEKRVYDFISSRCLERRFESVTSRRVLRYRCLEHPELCVDIDSMRLVRQLRIISAMLNSFDCYSESTIQFDAFLGRLLPYANPNESFWIEEDLHPFHLRT